MTRPQALRIRILSRCRFLPASRDKFWMKNLLNRLECAPHLPLTGFQAKKLDYLFHRYRRQHGRCDCLECLRPKGNPYQMELFGERGAEP